MKSTLTTRLAISLLFAWFVVLPYSSLCSESKEGPPASKGARVQQLEQQRAAILREISALRVASETEKRDIERLKAQLVSAKSKTDITSALCMAAKANIFDGIGQLSAMMEEAKKKRQFLHLHYGVSTYYASYLASILNQTIPLFDHLDDDQGYTWSIDPMNADLENDDFGLLNADLGSEWLKLMNFGK